MKSKFKNLDFGSIDLLSREQQAKIVGGYGPPPPPPKNVWYCPGQNNGPANGAYVTRTDCQQACAGLNYFLPVNAQQCQFA